MPPGDIQRADRLADRLRIETDGTAHGSRVLLDGDMLHGVVAVDARLKMGVGVPEQTVLALTLSGAVEVAKVDRATD